MVILIDPDESDIGSHVSDAIYTYGNQGTQDEFDEALKKMDTALGIEETFTESYWANPDDFQ